MRSWSNPPCITLSHTGKSQNILDVKVVVNISYTRHRGSFSSVYLIFLTDSMGLYDMTLLIFFK